MTPNHTPRSARRTARTAAIGAVVLTAAVALPAFAIDRGGDGAVDVTTAADAVESTTSTAAPTTTTTLDPAVEAWLQAQATEQLLAWIDSLTPDQKFDILAADLSPEERAAAKDFFAAQQQQLDDFLAGLARQAEQSARSSVRSSTSTSGAVASGSVWDSLAQCETGGDWSHPTVSGGFSGGLMFHSGTWNANGGQAFAPTAAQASREEQITVAERILANSGWGAWPGCSRKLGLR
jgi:hypothetical protein